MGNGQGLCIKNNSTFELADVKQLLLQTIDRVTLENWCNFIKHVIEKENKIWNVDDIMVKIIDKVEPCVFSIMENTSSFDSDSD